MEISKVLITGGAGFIGSNLVQFVNQHAPETEVVVLDDLSTGLKHNLNNCAHKLIEGSILDDGALRRAAKDADSIIHLAAIGSVPRSIGAPRLSHEANATGTLHVLEIARELNIPHVIVASSSSVYGANPNLPKNELDWTRPLSPYAVSKLATEAYAIAYNFSYGLSTLALRFFNVYGPKQRADHDYAAVIPRFLHAALDSRHVEIFGDGSQSRDFTYVGTVCQALFSALKNRISSPTPTNLAFGNSTSLLELVKKIEEKTDRPMRIEFKPPRAGDIKVSQAEPSRMTELFPDIRPTDLGDGLETTLSWMASEFEK
jgi:UDP-glucose 4-epimerase